ncbi:hypothetical protein BH11MYX1_BH11MYX1_44760 [soil metagenome]
MRSQHSATESSQASCVALSIDLNIAEGNGRFGKDERRFLIIARGSALECAAVLDAMQVVGLADPRIPDGHTFLVRLVSMITKRSIEFAYAYARLRQINQTELWG